MTRQSFVKGAVILTLAGLSVRFVGAFFRIVLAMLIADEGVGLFQMAYPIYSALLAISTAGIPIAISKLVAEDLAFGNFRGAYRVFRTSLVLLGVSGFAISLVMYLGAGFFARRIAQDERAYLPLVSMAPAIFFVTVMSAYRGFFQGQQQMLPTALSQVAEQVGRVAVALLLVMLLLPRGLEQAAAGASFGAVAGAFCGLLILLAIWLRQRNEFFSRLDSRREQKQPPATAIIYRIFVLSIPITLGSLVMPVISLVDLSIVPQRLHQAGFDTGKATALYGQLTGMAVPLVHIPTIITVALAVSLVPAISEAVALQRSRLVRERSSLAVRLTLLLGLPSAIGLYLLAEPITVLLFQNAEAGRVLAAMAFGVVFLTLYQTTSGILQGLGRTVEPVINLFYGALVKTILTWALTSLPALHIRGAALATVAGFAVAAFLNVYKVKVFTGMPLHCADALLKPGMAALGMGAVVLWAYGYLAALFVFLGTARANALATLAAVAAGITAYGILLFTFGAIKRADLETVPRIGPSLARLAEKLHLLRG